MKRWLDGEDVHVTEEQYFRNIRPYRFNGQESSSLNELALSFAENWEEAKKHLYRGLVRDFVKQFGEDYALKRMECEEFDDQDEGLFTLICALHQKPPLCWKGYVFNNLVELEEVISENLPEINPILKELVSEGILLTYLKQMEVTSLRFYNEIKRISELAVENRDLAYYRLAYTLSGTKDFLYEGKTFTDVKTFMSYLYGKKERFHEYATELVQNQYFFAWLMQLGYEEHLEKWRSMLTKE